jgi:hypothetical protein
MFAIPLPCVPACFCQTHSFSELPTKYALDLYDHGYQGLDGELLFVSDAVVAGSIRGRRTNV